MLGALGEILWELIDDVGPKCCGGRRLSELSGCCSVSILDDSCIVECGRGWCLRWVLGLGFCCWRFSEDFHALRCEGPMSCPTSVIPQARSRNERAHWRVYTFKVGTIDGKVKKGIDWNRWCISVWAPERIQARMISLWKFGISCRGKVVRDW